MNREGWTKLSVGFHWTRGPFTASTIATGDGSRSGYILVRNRQVLAEYVSWEDIERIVKEAEEHG